MTAMQLDVWSVEISLRVKRLFFIKEASSGSEGQHSLVASLSSWRLDFIVIRIFRLPRIFLHETPTFSAKTYLDFSSEKNILDV